MRKVTNVLTCGLLSLITQVSFAQDLNSQNYTKIEPPSDVLPTCQLTEADAQTFVGRPLAEVAEVTKSQYRGCIFYTSEKPHDPTAPQHKQNQQFGRVLWLNNMFMMETVVENNVLVIKSVIQNTCIAGSRSCNYLVGSARAAEDTAIHGSCTPNTQQLGRYIDRLVLDVTSALSTFYPNCTVAVVTDSKIISKATHPSKPKPQPKPSQVFDTKTLLIETWRVSNPNVMDWDAYFVKSIKLITCSDGAESCQFKNADVQTIVTK